MFLQTILRHPEGLSALKRAISWADLAAFIHHNTRCVVPDILWHIISCYLKALTRSLEHADIPNSYVTILLMFLQAILRHPEGLPLSNVPFRQLGHIHTSHRCVVHNILSPRHTKFICHHTPHVPSDHPLSIPKVFPLLNVPFPGPTWPRSYFTILGACPNSYVTILLMFLQTILRQSRRFSALERAIPWTDLAAFILHNTRFVVHAQIHMSPYSSCSFRPSFVNPKGLSALERAIPWANLAVFILHNTRCVVRARHIIAQDLLSSHAPSCHKATHLTRYLTPGALPRPHHH